MELSLIDEAARTEIRVSAAESQEPMPMPMPVWAAWCESPFSAYVCLEPWTSGPNPLAQGDAIRIDPGAVHRYRMDICVSTL